MDKPVDNYWKLRLADLNTALESNNFEVYLIDDRQAACKSVLEDIIPKLGAKSIKLGGKNEDPGRI